MHLTVNGFAKTKAQVVQGFCYKSPGRAGFYKCPGHGHFTRSCRVFPVVLMKVAAQSKESGEEALFLPVETKAQVVQGFCYKRPGRAGFYK